MAAAISGRTRPPLFTTGPATRHALGAAGALGATTGTVVHLPSVPAGPDVSAVLAHELTHTRSPVRRPRFFLGGVSSLLDDDERSALAAGARQSATTLIGRGSTLLGQGRSAASDLIGRGEQAAAGLIGPGRQALAGAGETAAGIVDQLPVGGGLGAVGDVATRAARAAVLEAAASPPAAASGFADDTRGAVTGALDSAAGAASGHLDQAGAAAGGLADQAAGAVSGAVTPVTGAAGGAVSAAKQALDPDKVVEIVEQRLLREIERRGGRWAGMF
jgi:hypothetical protein